MNNYRDVSDYEINKAVAIAIGATPFPPEQTEFKQCEIPGFENAIIVKITGVKTGPFDPCNNPADAMPIIIENEISMNYIDKNIGWGARHFDEEKGELEIYDKNYYRAAMICFLMMKDAENEKV